jgi:topoisomerase-4 subunit B
VQKLYALDEGELIAIEDKLRKDGIKDGGWAISRFKGLGEMNAEQLWETTMNPDTRRLMPVTLGDFDLAASEARFNMLMGKGEASARRLWLEEHGNEAEADI